MSRGLARVLERIAPTLREKVARGHFIPSSFSTPVTVAALVSDETASVVITETTAEAESLFADLQQWLPGADVALWPAWDIHPLERVSPDAKVMAQRAHLRWRISQGELPLVIVASARAIAQVLPPTSAPEPWFFQVGRDYDRDEVIAVLVASGYRREYSVEHRGEIAVRGGILDVWPAETEEPIRLDFFGDQLERIAIFDIGSQRSIQELEQTVVAPAREWMPSQEQMAEAQQLSKSQPWGRAVFDRISNGEIFDGLEGWMSLFAGERRCLLDELGAVKTFVISPEQIKSRLDDVFEEERELTDVVAATWQATTEIPLLHLRYEEALGRRTFTALSAQAGAEAYLTSAPVTQGDHTRIAAHIRGWSNSRRAVVLSANPAAIDRMAEQLRGEGLEVSTNPDAVFDVRVTVLESTLSHGFWLEDPEVVVWTESDLTGRRTVHRAQRAKARTVDAFFEDMAVGSYVVHRQHGVAKFSGTTTRAINGVIRDYLILEFKDGRSYWPTEQIDALTAYNGGDAPALSRMGSAEWQKKRAQAAAEAYLIAQELVQLYRERSVAPGHAFSPDTAWQHEMEDLFPFQLTHDQAKAVAEIKSDMESPRPMDRLVCADVGFGKTEIAVRAAFKAVQDNKQVAILAPTTLLASQHFATFSERYAGFPVRVGLLSRFVDEAESKKTIAGLADGSIDVVIGTHRLLNEGVKFKDLGLLVVDEEQRFGVNHKEAIKARSVGVDVLTLSASPIPRTLEMALTGIRDISMVTTPPSDRRPILTHVGEYDEPAVVEAIRRELLREGQIFFVHNRVADIDQAAKRIGELVPDARIAIAHGQMDEGTLERVMVDFWERKFDVLVCTTIVESGIDVPTVNTLIVDRADRLGLGQMHQLRGRVGRGDQRAYAYLFHPRDKVLNETAYERLRTIGDNTALGSGFKIAMRDLEIRGAGSLLGHRQSGPVAAVGYDLYVQLVAEAVAEAKGERPIEVEPITIDVPGEAHLPSEYVSTDDARLEAYRRLAVVSNLAELNDLSDEWIDRYGALPGPAQGLLDLAKLRLLCLDSGIKSLVVQPAKVGVRTYPVVKTQPLDLSFSQQMKLRRLYGSQSYNEANHEVRIEIEAKSVSPLELVGIIETIIGTEGS